MLLITLCKFVPVATHTSHAIHEDRQAACLSQHHPGGGTFAQTQQPLDKLQLHPLQAVLNCFEWVCEAVIAVASHEKGEPHFCTIQQARQHLAVE
jgi:hypothetical protein